VPAASLADSPAYQPESRYAVSVTLPTETPSTETSSRTPPATSVVVTSSRREPADGVAIGRGAPIGTTPAGAGSTAVTTTWGGVFWTSTR
jgi:hypothetical protein